MSGPRYERLLASTALALILAAPIAASAQEAGAPATPTTASEAAAQAGASALSRREAAAVSAPAPTETVEPAPAPKEAVTPASAASPDVASEQAAAPAADPLATLDPADRAVAEKIRDLLAAKTDKIFTGKRERAAAESFYQARHLAPLWLDKGVENARARAAIARLKGADADGLDPSDYKTPTFAGLGPDALAEAELKLTDAVLTYARHLQAG